MPKKQSSKKPSTGVINVRKEAEFEAFLDTIKNERVASWAVVARALGVRESTITDWKKHPLARKALADGIQHAISKMEKSGGKDWKMWREKLKMLGVREEKEELGGQQMNQFNFFNIPPDELREYQERALEAILK